MRRRISQAFRRFREPVEPSRGRTAAVVERLEGRCLLSLSAHTLVGPFEVAGNTWTYEIDSPGQGTLGFETLTAKGFTTFNGRPVLEIDFTFVQAGGAASGTQTNFYAYEPQAFVLLDTKRTSPNGIIDETAYSPAWWVIPESMNANVTVTSPPSTETETFTPVSGSPSISTDTVTTTTTLVSETPDAVVQVPAGTFSCYQVNTSNTTITPGNTSTGGLEQVFVDPTVGLIESLQTSNGTSMKLTNFTGTSFHLSVTQPPANTGVGNTINPVQVSVQNSSAAIDTNPADAVTLTASIDSSSTGTGTLSGTTSVATTGGVANFSNLSISAPGTYVLDFKDTAGRTVSTGSFQVVGGTLRFVRQIRDHVAGGALNPAVEVELVDSRNRIITNAPSLVTLSIDGINSSNPITGNTAQLVNGVAVFNEVNLGVAGDYTLNATDSQGDAQALSNAFEITAVPTGAPHTGVHLAFHKQHHKAGVNAPLRYSIRLEDSRDRVIKTSSIELGLTLNPIDDGPNAAISNPVDTSDFGVAKNSSGEPASINSPGTYTVTFSVISQTGPAFGNAIAPITSDPIEVIANHLAFIKKPRSKGVGIPLRYEVAVEDYRHHIVADRTDQLMFSLLYDGTNATLASGVDHLVSGIADNADNLLSINAPGLYRLIVVDVPTNPGDAVADSITSKLFEIRNKGIG